MPKHKASEKLQQSIKERIKKIREDAAKVAKTAGRQHDPFNVPRQGAGQIVLLGAPNVGKSSIVGALTNAAVTIAEFPFSTHAALPGMARHEDVPIQLVDMPPVMDGHAPGGMVNAVRRADMLMLVVDLSALDLIDQFENCIALLQDHGMVPTSQAAPLSDTSEIDDEAAARALENEDDGAPLPKRVLIVANKRDTPGAMDNCDTFRELTATSLKIIPISATTGEGLTDMMAESYALLNVIRVYAKKPGKPADREAPFILPVGGTVEDMARHIHNDLVKNLKHARVWGGTVHDGQQVTGAHVLTDKNVVELHI